MNQSLSEGVRRPPHDIPNTITALTHSVSLSWCPARIAAGASVLPSDGLGSIEVEREREEVPALGLSWLTLASRPTPPFSTGHSAFCHAATRSKLILAHLRLAIPVS